MDLSDAERENIKKILERNGIEDDITTLGPAGPSVYTASKSEFVTKTDIDRAMQEMRDEISKKASLIAKDVDPVSPYSSADISSSYPSGASARAAKTRGWSSSSTFVVDSKILKEDKVKDGYFRLVELEMGTKVKRFEVHCDGIGIGAPDFIIASIPDWFNEDVAKLLAEGIYNSVVEVHKAKDKLL